MNSVVMNIKNIVTNVGSYDNSDATNDIFNEK